MPGDAVGAVAITAQPHGGEGFTELAREELPTWRAVHGETVRDYLIWVGEDPSHRRAFAVSISPFFTAAGDFDGAVLAYHDVTELMTAARLKDEFVATVSHELRTPLTSIVGYVDVLLEDVAQIPPDARPFLLTVQRNARRLHRLVDDLLSDALKLGKAELHVGRISLPGVVRTSAVEAAKTATSNGLTFEFDEDDAPMEVNGDAERLAQVVDNIFNNAIKFTPRGGHVACAVERDGEHAVVRISDTGRGIPQEELDDVFVKFFRSPGVQTDAIPGTGIPWRLPADLGRRYAAVSGDRNPIHLYPLTARALGFPRQIAHGMWSKARCLAAVENRLPEAFRVHVEFRKPVLLPSTVIWRHEGNGDDQRFSLSRADGAEHLTGTVTGA